MRVLLIGGSGIISSEICNLSIERGMDVTILNRGKRKNLINPKARLIVGDIRNESEDALRNKVSGLQYDVIVDFLTYNVDQLKRNLRIFDGLYTQYIFVSSATSYSEKETGSRYKEEDELGNNKWKYAFDKSECEKYLNNIKSNTSFYTIIRPYVTYGKTRVPFQIVPIQYYTIINRIINDKPVILCDGEVKCTLTNSKDFAIATVGLFLNKMSYGHAFNITSDCEMTWEEVADVLFEKLGKEKNIIKIPYEFLKEIKYPGFDIEELEGDKVRNMIFDNSKIKETVPEFKGGRPFSEAIDETLKFYNDDNNKVINYIWDARVDRIIQKYKKTSKINIENSNRNYFKKSNIKNIMIYTFTKNDFLYSVLKKMKDRRYK